MYKPISTEQKQSKKLVLSFTKKTTFFMQLSINPIAYIN